jgi:hypothetical protein
VGLGVPRQRRALAVAAGEWLALEGAGEAHTMTLVLAGGQRDARVDLRPDLPVLLQFRGITKSFGAAPFEDTSVHS